MELGITASRLIGTESFTGHLHLSHTFVIFVTQTLCKIYLTLCCTYNTISTPYRTRRKGNAEMNKTKTRKQLARIAGVLYLLFIVLGFVSSALISSDVSLSGNASLSVGVILSASMAVRLGYAISLIGYICFLLLSNLLYRVFEKTDKGLARLMVIFVAIGVALVFTGIQSGEMIAAIFWGLWLLPLGLLILKSSFMPKIIAWLLFVACFSHVANFLVFFILPDYSTGFDMVLSSFALVGEVPLMLWLVINGVTERQPIQDDSQVSHSWKLKGEAQ